METRTPTRLQVLIAAGFALSCFGLLLFLWTSFGGPVPLKPHGYEVKVPVREAGALTAESDVRISGVSVGKVKRVESSDEGLAEATIELESAYAPIGEDTQVSIRQKTLLGETYMELAPGSRDAPKVPEGGSLDPARVSDSVQLDEVIRAFSPRTRVAFQQWMQNQAIGMRGRGDDLSAAIGNLEPFSSEANQVLRILDSQKLAVRELISNGGEVLSALSERRGQLRGLVQNADTVFTTTARRNRHLKETFAILPTFMDESRVTLRRLERFSRDTDPLVQQLRPAARELSPTLIKVGQLAPELKVFLQGLRTVINRAPSGFQALRNLLDTDLPPLLTELTPFLKELNPILTAVEAYKHEISAFLANTAAATNAFNQPDEAGGTFVHYLRSISPLGPEALAAYPNRLTTNRTNPYVAPLGFLNLTSSLLGFETRQCASGITASLDDSDAGAFPGDLYERIKRYAFVPQNPSLTDPSSAQVPTPPCTNQPDFQSIGQLPELSEYLHVRAQP
jgi:phospholipid/cholesterol/gamma-HCH transport system substrate-binding protein